MEFFKHREGEWESWRVTHHLAFRRSEAGDSMITMKCLDKSDDRIVQLCKDWEVDPAEAQGGCYVSWRATMAWDQEGENHEGSTVFALAPENNDPRKGKMLRDRGYAEIVPIAGTYYMDENDDLNLVTPYDGGEVQEQFSFDGPDVVNRVSTVQRFGGFSTATFATERRVGADVVYSEEDREIDMAEIDDIINTFSFHNIGSEEEQDTENKKSLVGAGRWGTPVGGKPSSNSAFGSGFSRPVTNNSTNKPSKNSEFPSGFGKGNGKEEIENEEGAGSLSDTVMEAAKEAGIDLSKIPPSMRDDFVASFEEQK